MGRIYIQDLHDMENRRKNIENEEELNEQQRTYYNKKNKRVKAIKCMQKESPSSSQYTSQFTQGAGRQWILNDCTTNNLHELG